VFVSTGARVEGRHIEKKIAVKKGKNEHFSTEI